ncbi:unnamed protein product [Staurois parvus]|uniref:Uncharacterized protein n=1 Tax=Staurois parvus TaxID=386267 RepID=A0ABN9BG78_9NEOB|nr:unnamed protein product [Staurois parvus]
MVVQERVQRYDSDRYVQELKVGIHDVWYVQERVWRFNESLTGKRGKESVERDDSDGMYRGKGGVKGG